MKGVERLVRPARRAEPAGPAAELNLNLNGQQTDADRAGGAPKGIRTPDLHLERVAS